MSAPSSPPPPRPPEKRTTLPVQRKPTPSERRQSLSSSAGDRENEAHISHAREKLWNRPYETVDGLDFERFKIVEEGAVHDNNNKNSSHEVSVIGSGLGGSYETASTAPASSRNAVIETEVAAPKVETEVNLKDTMRAIESAVAAKTTRSSTVESAEVITKNSGSLNAVDELEEEYRAFQIAEIDRSISEGDFHGAYTFIKEFIGSPGLPNKDGLLMNWAYKFLFSGQHRFASGVIAKTSNTMTPEQNVDSFFIAAEMYIVREKLTTAEHYCHQGINLRKITAVTEETKATMNDFMDQMARIMEALGNKMKAKFFRSKVPADFKGLMISSFTSTPAPGSTLKDEDVAVPAKVVPGLGLRVKERYGRAPEITIVRREIPEGKLPSTIYGEISTEIKALLEKANAVLASYDLACHFEDDSFRLIGTNDDVLKAFKRAVVRDDHEALEIMLTDHSIIDKRSFDGSFWKAEWSLLDVAVLVDNAGISRRLIELEASTRGRKSPRFNYHKAIKNAASYAGTEVTRLILEKLEIQDLKSLFLSKDMGFVTPMYEAARCRNVPYLNTILQYFREHLPTQANELLNAKAGIGYLTPLMIAAHCNSSSGKSLLGKNREDPKKSAECVRWFCEKYLEFDKQLWEVNYTDVDGSTALHFAVKDGFYDSASVLLQYGANPFMRTNTGETPLDIARTCGHIAIESLLEDYRKRIWPGCVSEFFPSNPFVKPVIYPRRNHKGSNPEHVFTYIFPKELDRVTVNYVGTLENGKEFSNSRRAAGPKGFEFTLGTGSVIQGWEKALPHIGLGMTAIFTVPPELGYGSRGFPSSGIPADATLYFEVELLKVNQFEADMEARIPALLSSPAKS